MKKKRTEYESKDENAFALSTGDLMVQSSVHLYTAADGSAPSSARKGRTRRGNCEKIRPNQNTTLHRSAAGVQR